MSKSGRVGCRSTPIRWSLRDRRRSAFRTLIRGLDPFTPYPLEDGRFHAFCGSLGSVVMTGRRLRAIFVQNPVPQGLPSESGPDVRSTREYHERVLWVVSVMSLPDQAGMADPDPPRTGAPLDHPFHVSSLSFPASSAEGYARKVPVGRRGAPIHTLCQ